MLTDTLASLDGKPDEKRAVEHGVHGRVVFVRSNAAIMATTIDLIESGTLDVTVSSVQPRAGTPTNGSKTGIFVGNVSRVADRSVGETMACALGIRM